MGTAEPRRAVEGMRWSGQRHLIGTLDVQMKVGAQALPQHRLQTFRQPLHCQLMPAHIPSHSPARLSIKSAASSYLPLCTTRIRLLTVFQ